MRAAVIDHAGTVTNVVLVDADGDYDPGEGLILVEIADDSPVGPGWARVDDGDWQEPPAGPAPAPAASPEERIAQLEAEKDQMRAELDELLLAWLMGDMGGGA